MGCPIVCCLLFVLLWYSSLQVYVTVGSKCVQAAHITRYNDDGSNITIRKSAQACENYKNRPWNTSHRSYRFVKGGADVTKREYPHVVALGFYNKTKKVYTFSCGGSLISNKFVVTAAHCIANVDGNKLEIVRMGTDTILSEAEAIEPLLDHIVKNVFINPNYNSKAKSNDIALVELGKEVAFTRDVRPACLHTEDQIPSKMKIAGWGKLSFLGDKSVVLQKATVSSISIQECARRYGRYNKNIGGAQVCAQDDKTDACPGDSGGPLQTEDNGLFTVVGVISFGVACGFGVPGVCTKIYIYLDWIEPIVWP